MNATADQIQGRGHMFKRLNNFILTSIKGIRLRSVGAVLLGSFAGLSFNSTIIPTVMSTVGVIDEFSARWAVAGYAVYSVMVWAVGGWAARKIGNPTVGGFILGAVGLINGVVLTGMAIGTDTKGLLFGGGAGLLYGAIGGMIITSALGSDPQRPESGSPRGSGSGKTEELTEKTSAHKKEAVRLFRYFRK